MGGDGNRFKTTQWSCILNARTKDETRRKLILDDLITTYWRPVYCYLRHKGFDNETAKDLTQDFFSEIVLGRNLVLQADQSKGKFRTFLLVALERFVVSNLRFMGRLKRGGQAQVMKLESDDLANLDQAASGPDPSFAFCHAWATQILEQVLVELEEEYPSTERADYWEIFRLKILDPIFTNINGPSYEELSERFAVGNKSTTANIVTTVKRRFQTIMKRYLRDLAGSEAAAEEDFNEIFRILSQSHAK